MAAKHRITIDGRCPACDREREMEAERLKAQERAAASDLADALEGLLPIAEEAAGEWEWSTEQAAPIARAREALRKAGRL